MLDDRYVLAIAYASAIIACILLVIAFALKGTWQGLAAAFCATILAIYGGLLIEKRM